MGATAPVAAAIAHFGEEPPISGTQGAGTVFFAGCNLRCSYCQNHQISQLEIPVRDLSPEALGREMIRLAREGCHNIELVTPSHLAPQILIALASAARGGLDVPVVYNTSGYDAVEILAAYDGVVDVYVPDLKYGAEDSEPVLSSAPDYWDVACRAVREMVRQCGGLRVDADGVATSGVIVRHLVLPNGLAGSDRVLDFVARLDPRPAVSLMSQYYPPSDRVHPLLQRTLRPAEYERVRARLERLGLEEGWVQELSSEQTYRPDFTRADPFPRR